MKHIPLIFSAPMMRANLAGTKDVTRRICKLPIHPAVKGWEVQDGHAVAVPHSEQVQQQYITTFPFGRYGHRYGSPGDVLWARETWRPVPWVCVDGRVGTVYDYAAEEPDAWRGEARGEGRPKIPWRPSIHMPRVACRFTAPIVSVRIERLQEITLSDCEREGSPPTHKADNVWDCTDTYAALWDSINGKGSWAANPWVWRIEYRNPHKEYRA